MLQPGRVYNSPEYRYGFNGMEKDDEIKGDGNSYTTHFRQYDPRLARWLSVDPKTQELPSYGPYISMRNNPIFNIDPLGDLDSPYFTVDGDFLGVDEEGFSGEIMITDRQSFEKNKSAGTLTKDNLSKDGATSIKDASLDSKPLAKIYTNVISNMKEVDQNKLYNNSISVYNNKMLGLKYLGYNDPEPAPSASTQVMNDGSIKVSMNINAPGHLNTVANAQNTLGIHEYQGHGIKGWGNGKGNHHKVYELQIFHSTFRQTTLDHQLRIIDSFNKYVKDETSD
jgi:RHS repeat-associated protein